VEAAAPTDAVLVGLLAGDEDAYVGVVQAWSPSMLRIARMHVQSEQTAQDVVQETWLAVVRGIAGFQGRSSLRTWVFRILANTARARGARDSRTVPVAAFGEPGDAGPGPTVPASRFAPPGHPWAGHWVDGEPRPWRGDPAQGALRAETRRLLEQALESLPRRQRAVVVLRDVEGFTSAEVCELLEVSEQNQRVLLHRGRAKVRAALEHYYVRQERSR